MSALVGGWIRRNFSHDAMVVEPRRSWEPMKVLNSGDFPGIYCVAEILAVGASVKRAQ